MLAIDLPLPRIAAAESRCARHLDARGEEQRNERLPAIYANTLPISFVQLYIGLVLSSRAILLKSPVSMLAYVAATNGRAILSVGRMWNRLSVLVFRAAFYTPSVQKCTTFYPSIL
jgi:hypothetical protein